jgi:hypothetical protein
MASVGSTPHNNKQQHGFYYYPKDNTKRFDLLSKGPSLLLLLKILKIL